MQRLQCATCPSAFRNRCVFSLFLKMSALSDIQSVVSRDGLEAERSRQRRGKAAMSLTEARQRQSA